MASGESPGEGLTLTPFAREALQLCSSGRGVEEGSAEMAHKTVTAAMQIVHTRGRAHWSCMRAAALLWPA
eukprot:596-Heterococcus_DN1.PRE.1